MESETILKRTRILFISYREICSSYEVYTYIYIICIFLLKYFALVDVMSVARMKVIL